MLEFGIRITILNHGTQFFITGLYVRVWYSWYLLKLWISMFLWAYLMDFYCSTIAYDILYVSVFSEKEPSNLLLKFCLSVDYHVIET